MVSNLSLTAAAVIFTWALWSVFSKHVRDGIFGKIIYSFTALSAFSVLVGHTDQQAAMTLALAMLGARQMILRYIWPIFCREVLRGKCDKCRHTAGDF